jgi:predicted lipid-binding transport protein (Tim44 family)
LKVLGCILGALALVTVVGGVLALATGFPSSKGSQSPTMAADSGASTSTSVDDPRATAEEAPGGTPEDATSASGTASVVVPGATATPFASEVAVVQPALELATFPLAS